MHFLRAVVAAFAVPTAVLALVPTSYTPSGGPIYEAPSGSRMLQNGTDMVLYAPNGTQLHVFENVFGGRTSTTTGTPAGPLRPRQTDTAGEVYALMGANDTLESFSATFVVPPPPTTFDSQFMWFSQGITTLDDTGAPATFMGAALQYGGSWVQGGSFYIGAVFYELIPYGAYVVSTLPSVSPHLNVSETVGISLSYLGTTTLPGESTYYDYYVEFTGSDAGRLPGPLTFTDIQLQLTTGYPEKLDWETDGGAATGIDFEVVNSGPQNGEVKLVFSDDSDS
ncbi:hypothetical protein HMN09_00284600 [Mycena chlorophos]|uniref:Uncharacterized protein n=1 Tax=Mycena chlorophos TaxID=658473 RepID=A0A8H6TIB1_MYCCL|nr:hypothetical protein HMN09_00284600 [Mycena chlorophos]